MNRGRIHWNEIAAWVDRLKDGAGLGVEPKIKGCVVGLNAHGITTLMSCEGHADPAPTAHTMLVAPWVTIVHPDFDEWDAKREIAGDDEGEQERIAVGITELTSFCARKLLGLLAEFYYERRVELDRRLIVYPQQETVIAVLVLTVQGAVLQPGRSLEARKEYLKLYQDEIKMFADFLKRRFLEINNSRTR